MTTVCFFNNYYRLFFSNVCSKYNNHTRKEECIIFITNIFLLLGLLTASEEQLRSSILKLRFCSLLVINNVEQRSTPIGCLYSSYNTRGRCHRPNSYSSFLDQTVYQSCVRGEFESPSADTGPPSLPRSQFQSIFYPWGHCSEGIPKEAFLWEGGTKQINELLPIHVRILIV